MDFNEKQECHKYAVLNNVVGLSVSQIFPIKTTKTVPEKPGSFKKSKDHFIKSCHLYIICLLSINKPAPKNMLTVVFTYIYKLVGNHANFCFCFQARRQMVVSKLLTLYTHTIRLIASKLIQIYQLLHINVQFKRIFSSSNPEGGNTIDIQTLISSCPE